MKSRMLKHAMVLLGLAVIVGTPGLALAADPDWKEVPAVMSGLLSGGLEVTAVHNHLNEMSPHVMYMHYEGHGDAVQMAKALRQALSASGTPLGGTPAAPATSAGPALDTKQIEQALGRPGRDIGGGVFQVTVPRAEAITEMGMPLLPAMAA